MKKFKGLISTLFLSVATIGIFSASVITNNNLKEDNAVEVKKAEAIDTNPSTVYIALASGFADSDEVSSLGDCQIAITGGSFACSKTTISTFANTYKTSGVVLKLASDSKRGFDYLAIPNPTANAMSSFILYDSHSSYNNKNAHNTGSVSIPTSENGLLNMYVMASKHGHNFQCWDESNQAGSWTYFDESNAPANTQKLFFVPSYKWFYSRQENAVVWPYLKITFSDSSTFAICASGVTCNDGTADLSQDESDSNRKYVYYFNNVPTKKSDSVSISTMTMYFNYLSSSDYDGSDGSYKFSISDANLTNWKNGTVNLFCINHDSAPSRITSFYYNCDPSNSFLNGSFCGNTGINWSGYNGTYPATTSAAGGSVLPSKASTLISNSGSYKLTFSVDVGDYFAYNTYDYLTNVSKTNGVSSFYDSSWSYNNELIYDYSDISSVTVVDENVNAVDKDDYLDSGSTVRINLSTNTYIDITPIMFKKSGVVEFSRTTSDYDDGSLTITFKSSGRTDTFSATRPNKITGGFSDTDFTFTFNYKTGRYETVVVSLAKGEEFQFKYNDVSVSLNRSDFAGYGADLLDEESTTDYVKILSSGGFAYYRVGWIPLNTGGTSTPVDGAQFFIEKITDTTDYVSDQNPGVTISDEQAAVAFGHRLYDIKTCDSSTKSIANNLKILYLKATYSGKVGTLKDISFNDYVYIEYVVNGNDYTGLTRKAAGATDAYNKYLWIQYFHNNDGSLLPPSSSAADVRTSLEYQESNNIIVIIVASMSILAIASLGAVNLLAIKKRKHK